MTDLQRKAVGYRESAPIQTTAIFFRVSLNIGFRLFGMIWTSNGYPMGKGNVVEDELTPLWKYASIFGVDLSGHQREQFRIYLNELWYWKQRMNLTGLSNRRGIILELFLDSLIPAPFLPDEGELLDVGSGAGFPGLPLKICRPGLRMTLLESRSKKVSFLRHVIRLLGLKDIQVIRGRIDPDGNDLIQSRYGLITARAVSDLNHTLQLCAPLLPPRGLLVSFLGQNAERELERGRIVMGRHGMVPFKRIPYVLPGKQRKRNTVIFRKRSEDPIG
jgi:16S rRNA (guanine527-N7)-methyltransferase